MRIKELINRFRNRGDPRIEIELDMERIMEIVGDETEIFENLYLTRELYLSLALISGKGVFVIVPYRDQPDAAKGREIRRCLGICAANSCIAFFNGADTFVLSWNGMELTAAGEDLYELIHEFYQKTHGISAEGWQGLRMLDRDSADRICEILAPLENKERPETDRDEMIDEDGQLYVKRYESIGIGPINTGLAGRQRWFPLSDINTDILVAKAAFGGWFGWHRFSQGEIGTGLLYALTCGCVGILPAFDIVQYLTGSMYFHAVRYTGEKEVIRQKEKVYVRKPGHKGLAIAGIFCSILFGLAAWRVLYQGLGGMLFDLFLTAAGNHGESVPGAVAEWLHAITESFSWSRTSF